LPKGAARALPQTGRRAGRSCPRFRRRSRWKGNGGRGTLEKDKPPILGLIQRGGQVVLRMLANVQQATIKPVITAAVVPGTLVHTDEYGIYARLPAWGYQHKTVCHAQSEYARDEDGDGFCEVHVNIMEGGRPPAARYAKVRAVKTGRKGAAHNEHHHDRPGCRQDGLFAKGKFCLIRWGRLVLPERRGRVGADRMLLKASSTVLGGSRPLGVDHEAAAVDGLSAASRPSGGAAEVGQGLSTAPAGRRRGPRHARLLGHSVGRPGGEPPCK